MSVGDELLDRHRAFRNRRRIRFTRAALVPLHDDEFFFERRIQVRERHLRKTRAAVKEQYDWFAAIVAANLNPLIDSSQPAFFQRCDAIRRRDRDPPRDSTLFGSTER